MLVVGWTLPSNAGWLGSSPRCSDCELGPVSKRWGQLTPHECSAPCGSETRSHILLSVHHRLDVIVVLC